MTRTIMAFGDSLTWGSDVANDARHPFEDRWPSVLGAGLGDGYRIIAEGLGGRTTAFDDWSAPCERNGAKILPVLLGSHSPLDLVIIMLGTNDLKSFISPTVHGPVAGMTRLIEIIRTYPYGRGSKVPQIMIVAPPHCVQQDNAEPPRQGRDLDATRQLGPAYAALAAETGCGFFDAATVAKATGLDGVHLDAANTRAIGKALVAPVRQMLA
ncbi:SGNH/GDSL hydrolase family protein [Paracoccus aurantiacus]|uniref:SGNH/GDSL hydrolase family protein n=1 Tax=Paracoccus aurantiacus TaxID=2599412 RepID=UPI003630BF74